MNNLPIAWPGDRSADPTSRVSQGIGRTVKIGNDLVTNDHGKSDLAYDRSGYEEQSGLSVLRIRPLTPTHQSDTLPKVHSIQDGEPGTMAVVNPQFCNHSVASDRIAIRKENRLPVKEYVKTNDYTADNSASKTSALCLKIKRVECRDTSATYRIGGTHYISIWLYLWP